MAKEKEQKESKEKQKQFQAKYLEFQLISEQLKQLQNQLQKFEENIMEARTLKNSLDDFRKIKPGTEIFVSLSPGMFAKAKLEDNEKLRINVGSNTITTKNVEAVKKMLDKQIDEMKKVYDNTLTEIQNLAMKAGAMEKELKEIAKNV